MVGVSLVHPAIWSCRSCKFETQTLWVVAVCGRRDTPNTASGCKPRFCASISMHSVVGVIDWKCTVTPTQHVYHFRLCGGSASVKLAEDGN
jgi:hypothetical protein